VGVEDCGGEDMSYHYSLFVVSRIWNYVMYSLARFFLRRIWDYTKRNKALLADSTRSIDYLEILIEIPKRISKNRRK